MNNYSYYGLSKNLFQKEINCEDIYESSSVKEGISRLKYLKEIKGIGLILGMTGIGKTTLIRLFISGLNKELYNIIYITLNTSTKEFDFLNIICKELRIDIGDCYLTSIKRKIQKEIIKQSKVLNKETIIVIDNAQKLSKEILNNLSFLYEFEMDDKDYTSIILCGEECLKDELKKSIYENLKQRIAFKYELETLSKKEVYEYITTRLEKSNQTNKIFTESAINSLANASCGVIRKLNKLINLSLLIGYQMKKTIIDEEIVRIAVDESNL